MLFIFYWDVRFLLPIGSLMREHRLIERMVSLIKIEETDVDSSFIDDVVDFFKTYADRCHHGKEEDILFKKLLAKDLKEEHRKMVHNLVKEHAYARKTVIKLNEANIRYTQGKKDAANEVKDLLKELSVFYQKHIEKEDKHFFYPSMDYFSKSELDAMLDDFWEFDRKMIHEKYERLISEKEEKKPKTSKNLMQSQKWKCTVCGYIYDTENGDPEHGIKPGTSFEELPEDWVCPVCFAPKQAFVKL